MWISSLNHNKLTKNKNAPINEATNPDGFPGVNGGLYDAGFDEAYINIAPDDLIFADDFE